MKIEIKTHWASSDCETCGYSYAQGGSVTIDGKVVLDLPAESHCFGGQDYSEDDLLVMALHKIGIEVFVDGDRYHITCHNDEYHGEKEQDDND